MSQRLPSKYAPKHPVARGGNAVPPGSPGCEVVSAVVGSNADLLKAACSLWTSPDDVIADVTYGKGAFWRWGRLPQHRFDLAMGVDMRRLPLDNASVDVVVMDPPYRPTHGGSTRGRSPGEMFDRYGLGTQALDTMDDVLELYAKGLIEAHRVLRPLGRVMVKCQDMSYQSRLHLATLDVLKAITAAGFVFADQFILVNTTRIARNPPKSPRAARRSHSVLWVGIKPRQVVA